MRLKASDPTFIDVLIPPNAGRNDRLDRLDRLIDWPTVAALLDDVHAAPEGRPAYRPITMVKIIVLQQWHDASDVGMEEALQDRLSFRRFAELTLTDAVPDHSTISRFRKKITERGLARMLFAEVNRQLEAKGMLVKRGTLIDATIIEAQARRPQSEAGARSGTDPDAAWTKKGKRSHFGYKMHIGMDAGSGLVRGVEFTPANVADTDVADALIMGDEDAVYADKAYESKERRERLRARGVKDRIMHRGRQASVGSSALAAAAERAAVKGSGSGGASARDAEALLRVLAGSVHGADEERVGGVVQGAGVQPAARGRVERGLRCAWVGAWSARWRHEALRSP